MNADNNEEFLNLYHNLEEKLKRVCPEYRGSHISALRELLLWKKKDNDANILRTMQDFRNKVLAHGNSAGSRPQIGKGWLKFLRKLHYDVDNYVSDYKKTVSHLIKKEKAKKRSKVWVNHAQPIGRQTNIYNWEDKENWDVADSVSRKNFRERLLEEDKYIVDLFDHILSSKSWSLYQNTSWKWKILFSIKGLFKPNLHLINEYIYCNELERYGEIPYVYKYGKPDYKFWKLYYKTKKGKNQFLNFLRWIFKGRQIQKYILAEYTITTMKMEDIDKFSYQINHVFIDN